MNKTVNPVIQNDIMRYKKNKLAANLALLGLVCGCIYFIMLYEQVNLEPKNFYYKWAIAVDVVYNLFFLLFTFLFSEQVKNYDRKYFVFQIIIGAMQVVRIFWLPLAGVTNTAYYSIMKITTDGAVISTMAFLIMTIALAASGALIIASAIIGYFRSKSVEDFHKKVENGEIDLDAELKKEEETEVVEEVTAGGEANA